MSGDPNPATPRLPALAWKPVGWIAGVRFALPIASSALAPIGFTADEYYYLACADQLAFGYVDHPPFSIALLSLIRFVAGDSLLAMRFVPALCEAGAVIVAAALARELRGGARAQAIAALATAAAPIALAIGLPYSMNPLEHLLWPLIALLFAQILGGAGEKHWRWVGLLVGLALMNKLSTIWLGAGLAFGMLVTPARSWLGTRSCWLAGAVALALLAPHLVWQAMHDWPTLEFIANNAAGREGLDAAVVMDSPIAFLVSQVVGMGVFAAPIWILGLVALLRAPGLEPQRPLGWAFALVLALLASSGRASVYYLVGMFPVVFAAGGVAIERFSRGSRQWVATAVCAAIALHGLLALPLLMPMMSAETYLGVSARVRAAIGVDTEGASLPPSYEWMSGGPELSDAVARAASLQVEPDRRSLAVLATTFGDAGALRYHRAEHGVSTVIGTHNSFWMWGRRDVDFESILVVANESSQVLQQFGECTSTTPVDCPHCEESQRGRAVFLCRDPRLSPDDLWAKLKSFI